MCAFAARMVVRRDVAEDLVQEVFLYVWRNRDAWHIERSVKQYLYAALRHGALRYLRHERVVRQHIPETVILFEQPPRLAPELPFGQRSADRKRDRALARVRHRSRRF